METGKIKVNDIIDTGSDEKVGGMCVRLRVRVRVCVCARAYVKIGLKTVLHSTAV